MSSHVQKQRQPNLQRTCKRSIHHARMGAACGISSVWTRFRRTGSCMLEAPPNLPLSSAVVHSQSQLHSNPAHEPRDPYIRCATDLEILQQHDHLLACHTSTLFGVCWRMVPTQWLRLPEEHVVGAGLGRFSLLGRAFESSQCGHVLVCMSRAQCYISL